MNIVEEIRKELQTREGKKKWNNILNHYIDEENEKIKKAKDLVSNTDYITWLNSLGSGDDLEIFINANVEMFRVDKCIYPQNKISDIDKEQIHNLYLFYMGIATYAHENYIYPIASDSLESYKIRLDDIGYKIGMQFGMNTSFLCKRIPVENENEFIDFKDVLNDKKRDDIEHISTSLNSLSNAVLSTYESGVPLEAIINTLEGTLMNIKDKEHPKVFKKW